MEGEIVGNGGRREEEEGKEEGEGARLGLISLEELDDGVTVEWKEEDAEECGDRSDIFEEV